MTKIQMPRKKDATWRGACGDGDTKAVTGLETTALHCFYLLQYACDAAVLLSLQCTPTSLSHSPHERAVAALVADSHSI